MTFAIKIRGGSSAPVEWLCPTHGSWETFESRAHSPDERPCPECGASSPNRIEAPAVKMPVATVVSGTSSERPPHALDTRPLANGMPVRKWRKAEREKTRKMVRDKIHKEMIK